MAATVVQKNRLLEIDTSLGENELILTSFTGFESVSKLFNFELNLFSSNQNISEKSIIGKPVSIKINGTKGPLRYFHGIVNRFYRGPYNLRQGRNYKAQIVPWFWFLNLSRDCRIFQNLSAKKIIQQVFNKMGMSDYSLSNIKGGNAVRTYCTQYHETAFQFISRLLEEEGIYYYFKHEKDKHTLILSDSTSGFAKSGIQAIYKEGSYPEPSIQQWEHAFQFDIGKRTQSSYDFERPKADLQKSSTTVIDYYKMNQYEHYQYTGAYDSAFENETQAKLFIEADEAHCEIIAGTSNYGNFSVGNQFELKTSDIKAEKASYTLIEISHQAVNPSSFFDTSSSSQYSNQFQCIPAETNYRPPRVTVKPRILGLQTAEVVGPQGEEIYCDKYGRIKVKFHWDRDSDKKKEESSCWIRVAQYWAGKQWGSIFTPRVGQEVIVSFLEGDPDQPLIIGSVYNADQMPPYTLPNNSSQSGIKTKSTKQGQADDSNELRFEDKKDNEVVYLHAQKDLKTLVEHDEQREVKNDQQIKIKNNRTIIVEEGDESITLKKGNEIIVIETGDETRTLKAGNRTTKINTGNDSLEIKMGNQTTKVSMGKSSLEAMQSIELKVGSNSIKIDQTGITLKGIKVTINGTLVQVSADASLKMEGAITEVNGTGMLKMQGALTMIN